MTSPGFVFFLTCLFLGQKMVQMTHSKFSSTVRQDKGFVSVNTGDNVTLQCFYEGDVAAKFYWYKQTLGQKPRIISTYLKYEKNGTFYNELKNDPRFTLDIEIGKNHLKMTDLRIADSAIYYCISSYSHVYEFLESITVNVKGSGLNITALVNQSASESIQPGDSVTLNCTVHTGTCDDGEHSVYWFKDSQESHPIIIFTHGGRNDKCETNSNTQTRTCVYNLSIKNRSHAGTYYCAVASCGQIMFGNGTKLDFEDEVEPLILVYLLTGALTFTTILAVLLAFSVCVIYKRNSSQCKESQMRCSAPSMSDTDTEVHQNEENITYAALKEVNRSRRQRNHTETDCVYSSVKQ